MKQPENIEKPQNGADHYDGIQDRLDRTLHRYEAVHQPKQHADHYENQQYLK
jgi:hypothetical protein